MAVKTLHRHGVALHGANADLWEIAEMESAFADPRLASDLARALGGRQDSVRVDASKTVIRALWARHPELGPYPFLESLSKFEFERTFYPQYRDHVCHQLKVYLLGIGILRGCPRLRDGVVAQLGGDAVDVGWLVTAVFHDVGYVVEADLGGAGQQLWSRVEADYAKTMRAPLHSTGWVPALTEANETAFADRLLIVPPRLGYQNDLVNEEMFALFAEEAELAGLRASDKPKHVIAAYYDYAQKTRSSRPPFRDHGVASALMLMRHWRAYDHYVRDWRARIHAGETHPAALEISRLDELERVRRERDSQIRRAAGAMSIHNITPGLWTSSFVEAAAAGLDFQRFRIAIGNDATRRNALAFLLALVDTLQDWDRPTFGDTPKPNALQGEDLSLRVHGERVSVHVFADHEEFRAPATSPRSRFGAMMGVLTSYLDSDDVRELVTWEDTPPNATPEPTFEKTLTTLLQILKTIEPPLRDEEAARLVESVMSAFSDSPIVEAAVEIANGCLPTCYSVQAVDVLGPEAWASPTAFRYLAAQLRHYARANVVDGKWNLKVSRDLEDAIGRAISNARKGGLAQSHTLFDDPDDFEWGTTEAPAMEYARILLWTKEELLSRVASIVIDTHKAFHVPLFFVEAPREADERRFDFICFRCATSTAGARSESAHGGVNERQADGRFRFSHLQNGMIRGRHASTVFWELLGRKELMFAIDAREITRAAA